MSELFQDKLTSGILGAYSLTDNVLHFGDYNIIKFNQRKRQLLTEFASNNGLELVNK